MRNQPTAPNDQLTVLTITPFFYYPKFQKQWKTRFDPLGGMHLLTYSITTKLTEQNMRQIVLTMGLPGTPRSWKHGDLIEVHATRLPVLPIKSKLEGYWGLVLAWGIGTVLWVLLNYFRLRKKVHLVHIHCDGSGTAPFVGYCASRLLGVPLVTHIHSSRALTQHPTTLYEKIIDPIAIRSDAFVVKHSEAVITLTDKVRQGYIERYHVDPAKIFRLASIIEDTFEKQDTEEKRRQLIERFKLPTDKKIILYLGRISSEKGCEFFVRCGQYLNTDDVHMVICGDGPERETITEEIRALGLESAITITGFITPDLVPSMIALADVGVVPSHYEELGLVILEFMTMRCPVVVHDVGGVSEFVIQRSTGLLVPHGDVKALAEAAMTLVDDKALAAEVSENAYNLIKRRYSMTSVIEKLTSIYRSLTNAIVPVAVRK